MITSFSAVVHAKSDRDEIFKDAFGVGCCKDAAKDAIENLVEN